MKGKGLQKKVIALLFVMLLVLGTVTTASASSGSTVLGNSAVTIKKQATIDGYSPVDSTDTMEFRLDVKRAEDKFNIYNLAVVTWSKSAATGAKNVEIAWVPEIKAWLEDPKNVAFSGEIYSTPEKLGKYEGAIIDSMDNITGYAKEEDVIVFLRAIREDKTLMSKLAKYKMAWHQPGESSYEYINDMVQDGNSDATDDSSDEWKVATVKADIQAGAFTDSYTVSKAPFGILFVDAVSSAREYQPVLINAIPKQVGPTGHWYVKKDLQYSLKYEDVGMIKKINGEDYDIVRQGEIVNFTVDVEIPKYQKDGDNYEFTMLNAFDDMAQGFTLIPTSAVIGYYDKDDVYYHPTANISLDAYGNMIVSDAEKTYTATLAPRAAVYYDTETGKDINMFGTLNADGKTTFWGKVNGSLVRLGAYLESTTAYSTVLGVFNNAVTEEGDKITTLPAKIGKRDYTKSIISISFDYTTLMDTLKVSTNAYVPDRFYVTYDAIVNTNAFVGNDYNTNDVYLHYIGDSAGTQYVAQDQVKAWTYAANIVKVDGSTFETTQAVDGSGNPLFEEDGVTPIYEDPTYLDETFFDLYRFEATYCGTSTATEDPSGSDFTDAKFATYKFYRDADDKSYAESRNNWLGTVNELEPTKSYSDGLLYKAIYNYYAANPTLTQSEKATKIGGTVAAFVGATTDYKTLNTVANKYKAKTLDADSEAIFKSYLLPEVETGGITFLYEAEKVESCIDCETEHYHVKVYSLYWSDIESVDNAAGVNVVGLDPNTYILEETAAKPGYHELSTALKFSIKKYNSAVEGSFKGFIDDEGKDITTGIYEILVKNYSGLVLPSTGGIGTMLFTIIGIVIMAAVMIIIIAKSRKRNAEIY